MSPVATNLLIILFWAASGSVIYTYLLYPALLFALSKLLGRTPTPPHPTTLPKASLLIVAHNEAAILDARIQNALATNYPADLLEIIVASDGSDDETASICARYAPRIRPLLFPHRRGKPATLEDAASRTTADILILSDANTFLDPDAARLLTRWFEDPTIAAVCGRLNLIDPATGRNADGLYWRYETFLKLHESRLGALLGANGAIYAIRRELLAPIPRGTIVDDFVIPLAAKLRTGSRLIYDPAAIAHEDSAPDLRAEFRRRVRISVGGWHSLLTLWPLLSPAHGFTALALWSHKVLRWTCPLALIAAVASSLALSSRPLYAALTIAQLLFHTLCITAALSPPAPTAARVLRLAGMFFSMNLALLVGFASWLRGNHTGAWQRTARS